MALLLFSASATALAPSIPIKLLSNLIVINMYDISWLISSIYNMKKEKY